MKKWRKKSARAISALMSVLLTIAPITACSGGGDEKESVREDATQIYVAFYNGGLGSEWFYQLKSAFEAKHPEYQVMPRPGVSNMDSTAVLDNFDTYDADLFFIDYMGSADMAQYRNKKYFADISQYVMTDKIEGENKTIWDKVSPAIKDYYNNNDVVDCLPWYQGSYNLIYDVALFKAKSFYVDAQGEWNDGSSKSLGQDGVAGTFDDGLPETVSDFFRLMDRMVSQGVTPLTMYGSGAYYFSSFLTNLFADYEGYNDFMLNYTLEGTDSDLGNVELEDAYRLKNGQKGKEFALQFAQRMMSNADYYSANSFQTSQDNYAAQTEFLISEEYSKADKNLKPIAMLVDGPWWEREALLTMSDMVDVYKNDYYAYGTREFGVMPMPEADDGSSAEGNTIACTSGRSVIFMNNLSKNKDAAGEFLKFCMSEEGLRIATAYSGVMRPYDYTLTDTYLNKMTPFGRSVYNYNKGTQVVFEEIPVSEFLRNEGSSYCSYLYTWVSSEDTTANVAQYFLKKDATVAKYLAGMAVDQTLWQTKVEEYRFRVGE